MIVNRYKFQSIIISSEKDLSKPVLNINGVVLARELSVKLLGIEIDSKLKFPFRKKAHFEYLQTNQQLTKRNLQTANIKRASYEKKQ